MLHFEGDAVVFVQLVAIDVVDMNEDAFARTEVADETEAYVMVEERDDAFADLVAFNFFLLGDAELDILGVDFLFSRGIRRCIGDVAVLVNVRNHAVVVKATLVFCAGQLLGFFFLALLLAL